MTRQLVVQLLDDCSLQKDSIRYVCKTRIILITRTASITHVRDVYTYLPLLVPAMVLRLSKVREKITNWLQNNNKYNVQTRIWINEK